MLFLKYMENITVPNNLCFIERILTTGAIQPGVVVISGVESLYSWSTDGVCWTGWVTLNEYKSWVNSIEGDYFLRLKFRGMVTEVLYCGLPYEDYTLSIAPMNFTGEVCSNPNLFSPSSNMDCAVLLQQQLADQVVCMFGIPIYYFQVDPNIESLDYTFKEYHLHQVKQVKELKLMLEDGSLPSSNPKLTDLDFDWEQDWSVEISKTQFATAFGDTTVPKYQDFIYVPMMKRMWKVNSAYDEKAGGLMWRATTWKLTLVKYTDNKSVDTKNFDHIIDNFIEHKYEEEIAPLEQKEQLRQSAYDQITQTQYVDSLYNIYKEDQLRHSYTRDLVIIQDKTLCHRHNVTSRHMYKFKEGGTVNYLRKYCGDSGFISFILETGAESKETSLLQIGPINFELADNFLFGVEDLSTNLQPFSTYLVVYRWDRSTHTKELVVYRHHHRTDMPVYLVKPESYFFDLDHPVYEKVGHYNSDYEVCDPQPCSLHGFPCFLTNIKYYNRTLPKEEVLREAVRYTTDHEACVFNDLARPIHLSTQYAVK